MTFQIQSGLLMSPEARLKRQQEKFVLVLSFLREETWTSTQIISELIDVSYSTAHQLLKKMSDLHLTKSAAMYIRSTRGVCRVVLHGVTNHGLAMSLSNSSSIEIGRAWEPSKLSPLFVPHQLELQSVRLRAERLGWQSWKPARMLAGQGLPKLPDAEAYTPDKFPVAIELERHIKSIKRYEVVIGSYMWVIKQKKIWQRIDYLCPTADFAEKISNVFSRVDHIRVEATSVGPGRSGRLEASHLSFFRFYSVSEWPSGDYFQARKLT